MFDKERVEISVGQIDGAAEGAFAHGAQHLGVLLDAMLGAGVAADGESKKDLGSVMKMAIMSNGELTPVTTGDRLFAECQVVCRVLFFGHSAKTPLPSVFF